MAAIETAKIDELFRRIPKNIGIDPRLVEAAKTELNLLKFRAGSQVTAHKKEPWSKSEVEKLEEELRTRDTEILVLRREIQKLEASSRMESKSSDRYSPLTVKQMYTDLYDDQWDAAYRYFHGRGWGEIEIIITLQRILRASHSFCRDVASEQLQNIKGEALCPTASWMDDSGIMDRTKQKISNAITVLARQYQQCTAQECVTALQKTFNAHVLPTFIDPEKYAVDSIFSYTKMCVEVTWFMCIQDPLMKFIDRVVRGSDFNPDYFQKYTTGQGDRYDYLVWPALLLHDKGPLLVKGVAQAVRNKMSDINISQRHESHIQKRKMDIVPDSESDSSPRRQQAAVNMESDDNNSWVGSRHSRQSDTYRQQPEKDDVVQPTSPYFDPYGRQSRNQVPKIHITDDMGGERSMKSSSRYTPVSPQEQERRAQSGHPLTVFWKENPDDRIPSAP